MTDFYIDPPKESIKNQWLAMWPDYDETPPPPDVLEEIWNRISNSSHDTYALFAYEQETNKLLGFIHYVLHNTTSSIRPRCYLEDGYVLPEYRREGIAMALYQALKKESDEKQFQKIYWITRPHNTAVINAGEQMAKKTDWVRFEDNFNR